jgi:hypothetical protein
MNLLIHLVVKTEKQRGSWYHFCLLSSLIRMEWNCGKQKRFILFRLGLVTNGRPVLANAFIYNLMNSGNARVQSVRVSAWLLASKKGRSGVVKTSY